MTLTKVRFPSFAAFSNGEPPAESLERMRLESWQGPKMLYEGSNVGKLYLNL